MATNIAKLQAQLQKVPDSALIEYVKNPNGQVPSYLALTELQRRKELRAAPQAQPQAMTQPSVAQQMMSEAEPGVASLPVRDDMYNEESYASGGIVAFNEGGDVPSFAGPYGSYVDAPGLSEADLAYAEAMRNSGVSNAASTLLDYTAFLPYTLGKKGVEYLRGRQPVWDATQQKYVLRSELPDTSKADADARFRAEGEAGRKVREDYLKANPTPQMAAEQKAQAASTTFRPYADPRVVADRNKAQIMADIAAGKYDQPAPVAAPKAQPGIGGLKYDQLKYQPYSVDEAGFNALMPQERTMRDYAAEFKAELGEDSARAKLKERIDAMEAKALKDEERAPWMALAEAGLGMAAGKSQFALQNIAEGGKQGIKSYVDARDRMVKAEERRFDLEAKVAQAERAEQLAAINYGADSKRFDDTSRRTIGLEKQKDKARAAEVNATNEYNQEKDKLKFKLDERQLDIAQEHYRNSEAIQREANLISKTSGLEQKQRAMYDKALDNARTDVMNSIKATGQEGMMKQADFDSAVYARYLANLKAMGLQPLGSASGFKLLGVENPKK